MIESKIKLLLVMKGYNQNKIIFRGKNNERYIMYGYWDYINIKDLEYVSKHTKVNFEINQWDDIDCGWLFKYTIKQGNTKNE